MDALLSEVGGLLADLTSPADAAEDEENEQARRVIDVELQRFWQSYYELKRRHDENSLSVAVLALTKSGKSTLLNSLMGMEVLPMNNVPETARICRIQHDAAAREPLLRDGTPRPPIRGEAAIRSRLQELNSAARTNRSGSGVLSPQSSGGLGPAAPGATTAADIGAAGTSVGATTAAASSPSSSSPGSSSVLHISAPLVALEGFGSEFGRVVLLDTPGPNEAGEEQLKFQVERLLEGVDCVLYLLDYTKLKTAEEEDLFHRLRAINPQLVARLSSRLFFVINKVDAIETSEGLDPDEVRAYVADLVTRQLGSAAAAAARAVPPRAHSAGSPSSSLPGSPASASSGFGGRGDAHAASAASAGSDAAASAPAAPFRLHPDQVLLLSARNALLARLVLSGRAGPEALRRFQRLAFGAFGMGGMGLGRGGAAAGPSPEQMRAAAGCLLEGSGILDLEGRVLAFLAAHAGSVKLLATADDTSRLLDQVHNVALACRSCLHRNVSALQQQAEELRGELAEAGAAFEEVRRKTDGVQAEVVAEIKAHLSTLRRRLFTHIVQTLDTDARAPPPGASDGALPHGSCGGSTTRTTTSAAGSPFSRWARVREKFLSMFTATSSTLPPHSGPGPGSAPGAGPSLVPEARSRSREELQSLLLDLHDDLMGQIHSEVYDFWGVLEACAASRHSEVLAALNGHLAALSRRVEGAVSEALGVTLAPADIRLRPPSAEQLHSDVQELIERGIRESTEKHIRVGTRTTTERMLREPHGPSLCRWGGYWVDVPRTRTVVETYTATVYSLKPDEIANHFIGLVDGAVSASERALSSYVGALVERQLAAAKERLRDYGDRYLGAMSAALAASSRGAEYRASALAAVEGYLDRLAHLADQARQAQRQAEAAVPGGAAGLMDEVEVFSDEDDGGSCEGGEEAGGIGLGEEEKAGGGLEAYEEGAEAPRECMEEAPAAEKGEEGAGGQDALHRLAPAGAEVSPDVEGYEEPPEHPADEMAGSCSGIFGDACSFGANEEGEEEEEEHGDNVAAAATGGIVGGGSSAGDLAALLSAAGGGTAVGAAEEEKEAFGSAAAPPAADSEAGGRSSRGGGSPRSGSTSGSWSTAGGMYEMVGAEEQVPEQADVEQQQQQQPQQQQEEVPPAVPAGAEVTGGVVESGAVPSLLALAEAALEGGRGHGGVAALEEEVAAAAAAAADVADEQQEAEAVSAPAPVPVRDPQAAAVVQPVDVNTMATAPLRPGASSVLSGSSSGLATYSAPFDYGRAFLEAMSSSEIATAEGTLTMIPLTADGDASPQRRGRAGSSDGAGSGGGGGVRGIDTPRSGASDEWQLVGDEEESEGMERSAEGGEEGSKE